MLSSLHHDRIQVRSISATIGHLDREISSLKHKRQVLAAKNEKLLSNIAVKQATAAPMRTLIPELCEHIFWLYLESRLEPCCTAEQPDPLVLARVCRRWRYLVLNSPRLWTYLHVSLCDSCPKIAWQILHWFRHANPMPLRVSVCPGIWSLAEWSSQRFKGANTITTETLKPYLGRISSFKLQLHQEALSVLFPPGHTAIMPSLSRLYLRHSGFILSEQQIGQLYAPLLRSLRVCDPSPLTHMLSLAISSLEHLQIDESEYWEYPRKVPKLLCDCLELQDLSIVFPRNLILSGPDPVVLPKVSRMKLEWRFPSNPVPIFSSVIAPCLRNLCLSHTNFLTMFSHETVSTLHDMIQSSTQLTTLSFVGCNLSSISEHSSFFCDMPQLRELIIRGCFGTGTLLAGLSPSPSDPYWPCPNLIHLEVSRVKETELRDIIYFARRRMASKSGDTFAREGGEYLKELTLNARLQDFTPQARAVLLAGLDVIRHSVKISGPLQDIQLALYDL
ncbi:hypothetical protein FA15DRAFT_684319 [Coprinopsis marcescibilis]|uniref:F-box domain-containing protein n=1 Tax=Coprinopsis marcescibilis TaxID=230819 RepID=A0A5C3LC83_COPMA|nr:hypothetical protein FA15DRAFT_684319 [Coprinopsis marcescibilis]